MKPVCWWCCHGFEGESLHFPYKFKSNVFYTTGHFCSWECMKSYAFEKDYTGECEFITLMKKRMEGKITPTRRAPSRYCLEMFGGTETIESFRKCSKIVVNIPGEVFQEQAVIKEEKPVDASGLKLKREKPLERAKGKLETSLNVIRKCQQQRASGAG
jgi:hypothetical protein